MSDDDNLTSEELERIFLFREDPAYCTLEKMIYTASWPLRVAVLIEECFCDSPVTKDGAIEQARSILGGIMLEDDPEPGLKSFENFIRNCRKHLNAKKNDPSAKPQLKGQTKPGALPPAVQALTVVLDHWAEWEGVIPNVEQVAQFAPDINPETIKLALRKLSNQLREAGNQT